MQEDDSDVDVTYGIMKKTRTDIRPTNKQTWSTSSAYAIPKELNLGGRESIWVAENPNWVAEKHSWVAIEPSP